MEKYLTIKELSERLNIPLKTLYGWTSCRRIPHFKVGKSLRFNERQIQTWIDQQAIEMVA